jgi:hypothetical protein
LGVRRRTGKAGTPFLVGVASDALRPAAFRFAEIGVPSGVRRRTGKAGTPFLVGVASDALRPAAQPHEVRSGFAVA